MTEAEWLACTDPQKMLVFLRGKVSDRKLRLFACACCYRLRHYEDTFSTNIVETAERHADGLVSRKELQRMSSKLATRGGYSSAWALNNALHAVLNAQAQQAAQGASAFCGNFVYFHIIECVTGTSVGDQQRAVDAKKDEQGIQTIILRDVVANPFCLAAIIPGWRTWNDGTAMKLVQGIYDERAFDRLPILADALEEAGCTNAEILAHCREPGEHVRGCWVVDRLLGKE
jgi:hypothetical protein